MTSKLDWFCSRYDIEKTITRYGNKLIFTRNNKQATLDNIVVLDQIDKHLIGHTETLKVTAKGDLGVSLDINYKVTTFMFIQRISYSYTLLDKGELWVDRGRFYHSVSLLPKKKYNKS